MTSIYFHRICILFVVFLLSTNIYAQQVIQVSKVAWDSLASSERDYIQKSYIVNTLSQDAFGIIIDNQGVDESKNGTTSGAALGGAVANAAYIDKAIRGHNYSAMNQLAAGVLGSMLGSTLDSKAKVQYHFRYAIKMNNGNIQYVDNVSNDPFRHPVGVCVSIPNIELIEQQLCTQTAKSLRITYLQNPEIPSDSLDTSSKTTVSPISKIEIKDSPTMVNCKLGSLAPVRTTSEKCELIKGSQVQ